VREKVRGVASLEQIVQGGNGMEAIFDSRRVSSVANSGSITKCLLDRVLWWFRFQSPLTSGNPAASEDLMPAAVWCLSVTWRPRPLIGE
jgi:hypothetical protein